MFDLAQVTDLHLVEPHHQRRTGADWQRLHYLSAGRRIDFADRFAKAVEAVRRASRHAAHLVLTGDLTEDGVAAQYDVLAEVLAEARIDPRRVTLVPGNHDLYADPRAYEQALLGPLRPYAATSRLGHVLELGGEARLLPISTAIPQTCLRSVGQLADADIARIHRHAADSCKARKLPLVAQHHPPHGSGGPAWNWIDGLLNAPVGRALVAEHPGLHVLHGHTHKRHSVSLAAQRAPQVHSESAAVASAQNVRFYRVAREVLSPVELPRTVGGLGHAGVSPAY